MVIAKGSTSSVIVFSSVCSSSRMRRRVGSESAWKTRFNFSLAASVMGISILYHLVKYISLGQECQMTGIPA